MDAERLKKICDTAIAGLKKDKELMPTLIVEGVRGNAFVGMAFADPSQKYAAMEEAGRRCAIMLPTAVTFISEGWMSQTIPADGQRVSEMPDKQECIVVIHELVPGTATEGCVIPFTRIGDEILLGETIERPSSEMESYLLLHFWHGVVLGLKDMAQKFAERPPSNN